MERTKDRRGTAPMSADAERALIVTFPPVPLYGGRPPAFLGNFSRRAKPSRTFLLAPEAQAPSSSQSPLYSGRPSMGIRHVAPLLLLSPPNPLRWALAGTPIKCLRCTNTAWPGITVAGGDSIQKGNEVSHKAFLPTFFSKKVGYSRRSTRWTWTQRFLSVSMVKRQALILQGPSASS